MEIADLAFPLEDEDLEYSLDKPKDHQEYSVPSDLLPHEQWSRHSEFAPKLYVSANIMVPSFLRYDQNGAKEAAHNGCASILLLQNRLSCNPKGDRKWRERLLQKRNLQNRGYWVS